MDTLMIVLRVIHIFAGIYWVGAATYALFFYGPAEAKLGAVGQKFSKGVFEHTKYAMSFPIAAISTTVAGLWLYYKVSDGFNSDWMSTDQGMVLSIGAVAGLLAFGHGAGALGKYTGEYEAALKATDLDAPTPEQTSTLQALQAKLTRHGYISFGLVIVAVFCMASARYF